MIDSGFFIGALFGMGWFVLGAVFCDHAVEDWRWFDDVMADNSLVVFTALVLWPLVLLGWALHHLFYGHDNGAY